MLYKNNPIFKENDIKIYHIMPMTETIKEFNTSQYFISHLLNTGYCREDHSYLYRVDGYHDPHIPQQLTSFNLFNGDKIQGYAEFRRFLGDKRYSDEKFNHYYRWFTYNPKSVYPSTESIVSDVLSQKVCNDICAYYLSKKPMKELGYQKYYITPTISMESEPVTIIDDIMDRTYLKIDHDGNFDAKEFILLKSKDELFTIIIYKKKEDYRNNFYYVFVLLDDMEQRELELDNFNTVPVTQLENLMNVVSVSKTDDSYQISSNSIDSLKKNGTIIYVEEEYKSTKLYRVVVDEISGIITFMKYHSSASGDSSIQIDPATINQI